MCVKLINIIIMLHTRNREKNLPLCKDSGPVIDVGLVFGMDHIFFSIQNVNTRRTKGFTEDSDNFQLSSFTLFQSTIKDAI